MNLCVHIVDEKNIGKKGWEGLCLENAQGEQAIDHTRGELIENTKCEGEKGNSKQLLFALDRLHSRNIWFQLLFI